jgi:farnesyl diphosphate synthase
MDGRVSDPQSSRDFTARLDAVAAETDALLDALLDGKPAAGEVARPPRLLEAMRHASLGGGKRLRPFLLVETATLFGAPRERALMAGAALECVHCYSLVHDDLPAMDNDDLRRGRATVHRAFDESTAILAGDALLTFAFDLMTRPAVHPDPQIRLALVSELARAAGLGGMAGGQLLDLAAEGRFDKQRKAGEAGVTAMQAMKTGALIRFACRAGAIIGNADAVAREALDRYGRAVGQAFQIADDLLDLGGDAAVMGKGAGKDAVAGKATLPGVLGADAARAKLKTLVAEADDALKPFASKAVVLRAAAHFVAERRN